MTIETNSVEFSAPRFIAAMAQGGAAAEREARGLMARYRPILRGRFYSHGVEAQEVDDLIAEVFAGVIQGASGVRVAEAFGAWVLAIADNVLKQHWQRERKQRRLRGQPPPPDDLAMDFDAVAAQLPQIPDHGLSDPVLGLCLSGQMARFASEQPQRQPCIELLAQGHDMREMAQFLGRSYGATRQFVSQCCAVLLDYLRPCLDEAEAAALRRGRAVRE